MATSLNVFRSRLSWMKIPTLRPLSSLTSSTSYTANKCKLIAFGACGLCVAGSVFWLEHRRQQWQVGVFPSTTARALDAQRTVCTTTSGTVHVLLVVSVCPSLHVFT